MSDRQSISSAVLCLQMSAERPGPIPLGKLNPRRGRSEAEAIRIATRERVERLELEAADPKRSQEAFRRWLETRDIEPA
jgi:hypothetical protein